MATAPAKISVGPSKSFPPMSLPSRIACTARRSPTASMSNTALASAWSPTPGGSPLMHSTLVRPSAAAASSSDCSAMRFRSLQVTCRIVSMPRSDSSRAAPMGAMDIFDPAESVRLKAVTAPRSDSAFLKRGPSPVPLGGFSSQVTANSPDSRICDSLLILRPLSSDGLRARQSRLEPASLRLRVRQAHRGHQDARARCRLSWAMGPCVPAWSEPPGEGKGLRQPFPWPLRPRARLQCSPGGPGS